MNRVTMAEIIKVVAAYYKVSEAEIIAPSRFRRVVRPRQVVGFLCKELTPRSYPEIGRKLGGKDHSTIIHGCKVIRHLIETDYGMRRDIDALRSSLGYHTGTPCNDNESTAESIAAREAYFRMLAAKRRKFRIVKARVYLAKRKEREFARCLESMDDMAMIDLAARNYVKQPLAVRMAE